MSGLAKALLAAAALVLIVGLYLVLRPDDARDEPAELAPAAGAGTATEAGTTTEASGNEEATTETGETATEPAETGPRVLRFTVTEGEADIERVEVERGERVVLVVRSDVADHIHLHGYDLMSDVAPGEPARIRFRADIPGRFEVELEDRQLQFAQLTVSP